MNNTTILQGVTALLMMTQDELALHIEQTVPNVTKGNGYLLYKTDNESKPMLCVHLDTINTHYAPDVTIEPSDFEYDETLNILGVSIDSKLNCLGGDDRAGVWIALQIIHYMVTNKSSKYNVCFFRDEEIGCLGSSLYKQSVDYIPNTTCYIGLDRKSSEGSQEVAIYGNDNQELIDMFTKGGYSISMGSITDAAELADETTSCINLSVGYDNEHTTSEVLYLDCMYDTLEKLLEVEIAQGKQFDGTLDYWLGSSEGFSLYDYSDGFEEENIIFREYLEALGYDPEQILTEGLYYV